ncbi:transposase [Nostoc sp. NIES-3756]|nr:transposase [Nostoc sp. NIES-3756]BAY39559.1 transposase [Nostoc sp. NIES-2111]
MSKVYPSNLNWEQYQLISDIIPEAKPGGRKREVDMWEVLNAIFYILIEGVRWRALPGDFLNCFSTCFMLFACSSLVDILYQN